MRILQLIDSLRPGGAEKMAVNIANALLPHVEGSFLCCTRQEGMLKEEIKPEVGYLFLNKKGSLDLKTIFALRKFIAEKNIDILHAHGPSFFYATLLKIITPGLKLVWHDHLGNRSNHTVFNYPLLFLCSYLFNGIITVNDELQHWANRNLGCRNSIKIPNFITQEFIQNNINKNHSQQETLKIVYLANLKKPKNHINLLNAFKIVLYESPNCDLLLIGKNYGDEYENRINDFILKNRLTENVFLLGEQPNVIKFLNKAHIGVISSNSEGLPMALLEYGIAKLSVISTDVGECSKVIGMNGKIIEVDNPKELAKAIIFYLGNEEARKQDALRFNQAVIENYSEDKIMLQILAFYKSL